MVLDVLEFVGDDDGVAGLAVLEGGGVGAAWEMLVTFLCGGDIEIYQVLPST